MKTGIMILSVIFLACGVSAASVHKGIYYGPESSDEYRQEKCKLDIYMPDKAAEKRPVLVYFHGGGLTGGKRGGPMEVVKHGIILVAPSYRLAPKVKCPDYINDAADAVAWTFKNIAKYGGNPDMIFVGGFSAGSYLTAMLGMDKQWLAARGIDADKLAGLLPLSGQMITHFNVRKERNISPACGLSDEFSPMFHIRKTAFPIFIQCGDNDYPSRQEENKLFVSMMKKYAKQADNMIFYQEYPGGHGPFFKKEARQDVCNFILAATRREGNGLDGFIPFQTPKAKVCGRVFDGKIYINNPEPDTHMRIMKNNLPQKDLSSGNTSWCVIDAALTADDQLTAELSGTQKVNIWDKNMEFTVERGKSTDVKLKNGSDIQLSIDAKRLRIVLKAVKDKLVPARQDHLWTGDALEVFIDQMPFERLDKKTLPDDKLDTLQLVFAAMPSQSGATVIALRKGLRYATKASCKTSRTADGYVLEADIPLEEIPVLRNDGAVVGITFQRCTGGGKNEFFTSSKPAFSQRSHYALMKVVSEK
jgi:acetyl esterase/lipase